MILTQKKIRILLLLIIIVYVLLYVLISAFNILNVDDLYTIRNIVLSIFTISLICSFILLSKKMKISMIFYCICGMALMLFFISSIFILKIEDLFFWDIKRYQNKEFFDFAFLLLGCNYILAIPYVVLLISEIAFFRSLHGNVAA